jgi:molybdopterin-containing oxidoreductase family membrane subunit
MNMATEIKSQRTSMSLTWLVAMVVLVVIGAIAWIVQLSQGMSVLGIGQIVVWGLYIAAFFTLVGLASGLLIMAVLADLKVIPGLLAFRRNLLIGALASYVGGGFMILMDIGKPLRVLNMVFYANFSSPFVWDFLSLALGVVMTVIYLFVAQKGRWLSIVTGIVAGLVVVFEGWILSMSAGSPLWSGGMMPAIFLVEGLLAALAVTFIAKTEPFTSDWLRRGMLVLLPIILLFNIFEFAAALYAGDVDDLAGTNLILSNPMFWLAIVLGIILPFVFLLLAGRNRTTDVVAAVLVILGVFVAKSVTLVSGQAISFMMGTAVYKPSIVEFAGVIGIVGLAGLLFILGNRYIPQKKA